MNRLLSCTLLVLISSPLGTAGAAGMFRQGSTQIAVAAGNGYAFDNSYFVLAASATRYVRDGLGIGLSYENWSGGDPGITKYAPIVQYVFYQSSVVQPFAGVFYRHTAIAGLPGINSIGGRAGIFVAAGPNAHVSAGLVHESYRDCQRTIYRVCSETYPEFSLIFGF